MRRMKKNGGFTLIELVVVITILGILAAIIVPQFSSATTEARGSTVAEQLQSMNGQIMIYYAKNGNAYPAFATEGWGALGDSTSLIGGHYIGKAPKTPAWTSGDATSISVVTGAVRGSATTAWVWNSTQQQLFASYYNEDTGKVTTTATD